MGISSSRKPGQTPVNLGQPLLRPPDLPVQPLAARSPQSWGVLQFLPAGGHLRKQLVPLLLKRLPLGEGTRHGSAW